MKTATIASDVAADARATDLLATGRLALRELDLQDTPFVQAMLDDDAVMRFYPRAVRAAGAAAWIGRQIERYDRDGHGLWLVELAPTNEPVGMVGLCMQLVDGEAHPEIGYLVHSRYWRRGIATEAAIACRTRAFDVYDYEHVISLVRPVNLPSAGVARKLGMRVCKRALFAELEHDVYRAERASCG